MDLESTFKLIADIDKRASEYNFIQDCECIWPIIRSKLWLSHIKRSEAGVDQKSTILVFLRRYFARLMKIVSYFIFKFRSGNASEVLFVSRPVYLEKVNCFDLFDRIMDPVLELEGSNREVKKIYINPFSLSLIPTNGKSILSDPIFSLFSRRKVSNEIESSIREMFSDYGITLNQERFIKDINRDFSIYSFYKEKMKSIINKSPHLKKIYVVSWYFPDMMGVISAAHEAGLKTIDIQHGKQGAFQAMYNGWDSLDLKFNYKMMPDFFWCWGSPTKNEISKSGVLRRSHFPIIGGNQWFNYYFEKVAREKKITAKNGKVLLYSMQPPQSNNLKRVPEFIKGFMRNNRGIYIVFRLHPNDKNAKLHVEKELALTKCTNYEISGDKKTLYNDLIGSTHHITAYSSVCYEAELLGVPTMLFGKDSKAMYRDEINKGRFSWTNSKESDLIDWVNERYKRVEGEYILKEKKYAREFIDFVGS